MNKHSPTISTITKRTVLCLALAISIFALASVSNPIILGSFAILLLVLFAILSFYALRRVQEDIL